jgi:uncharacterized membrane protein YfcA
MKRDVAHGASHRPNRLSSIDVPLAAAVGAIPAVALAAHLPSDLLLPAVAALALVVAALAATIGWIARTRRDAATVTIWDLAGACVLIGVAAGAFSEPDQVMQFFGAAMTPL